LNRKARHNKTQQSWCLHNRT